MKIIADQNIYQVREAFSDMGTVVTAPGYKIGRQLLVDADILLTRSTTQVTRELLEGTPVKFVASATIGVDHVDTEFLRENCIGFAHAPGSNADSVAEYVTAALLEICVKSGRTPADLTLGIIGAGNVGSRVYRRARTLGMECVLNDPPQRALTGNEIYKTLDETLERSDIISLHVPLIESGDNATCHIVNSDFVSRMKQGAALINTSRGRVLDENSFRTVCSRLGIIVLDVFENEPAISVETLRLADIATPHIAGHSLDGKLRGTDMIYARANAFFFKRGIWDCEKCDMHLQKHIIDLSKSKNPIHDGVKKAYSIMKDDEKLRHIYSVPKDEQMKFFEELRSGYPKRLEFPHFTLLLGEHQSKEAAVLKDLRFETEVKPAAKDAAAKTV
ncbi:MAG: 4-phosphoerythronate dehydrogenase [Chitinispirillales bacterium]|jgi:erythronate-4-phosphate dehydrogenase|nr:4-phosphoerythronate dehydrogenase [Chitinispirillales bacterium]